jgi:glycosyltransferase involved in cell wall biosynthesis
MHSSTDFQTSDPSISGDIQVSVIIPARNVSGFLPACFDALILQDFPNDSWEVILVDNGSTDNTIEIALTYSDRLTLRVVEMRDGYISSLRNRGASLALGDVLAFLDADCSPAADWLLRATALSSPHAVVGAFYRIPPYSSWLAKSWYGYDETEKHGPVPFVPSGDLIVRKATFFAVGGFDETLETNEDYDFCNRAQKAADLDVIACPDLAVTHFGTPQTIGSFYRKQRWHGKHVFAVTLRNLAELPNARAISFALYTLCCLVSITSGIIWEVYSGRPEVLFGGCMALFFAPLVMSTRLVMRRKRWNDAVPLTILFLTYGIARAHCLLDVKTLFPGRPGSEMNGRLVAPPNEF